MSKMPDNFSSRVPKRRIGDIPPNEQGWLPSFFGCRFCSWYKKINNTYVAGQTCKNCKGKENEEP